MVDSAMLDGKSILITGGTGSFGKALGKRLRCLGVVHDEMGAQSDFRAQEEIAVALVVRPDVVLLDGDVSDHQLDEPVDVLHARRLGLVRQDLFGDELLDDPPLSGQGIGLVAGRHMPPARTSTQLGDPLPEVLEGNAPPSDRGNERFRIGHPVGQPFTPPTVIPSMKKRWAKMNRMTTGRTMSVDAAISRL